MAQLQHAFGASDVTQLMGAEIGQPGALRQIVDHQLLGGRGQHRLAAVRQIPYPRRPVDRGPHVVGRVAELNLTGVQADPQPQRRQRRPLQRQRTCGRVAGPGERDDETVALALFDGTHSAVAVDEPRQRRVQARHRLTHLGGLVLPQGGGTLDVGQQQRHRSGRQFAHAQLIPIHRRVRAGLRFTHASQHATRRIVQHQRICVEICSAATARKLRDPANAAVPVPAA